MHAPIRPKQQWKPSGNWNGTFWHIRHTVPIWPQVISTFSEGSNQAYGLRTTTPSSRLFGSGYAANHKPFDVEYVYGFVWWGSASKVDDVTALPSRHKMADMCYYGNVMTTTWWWLCVFYIFNSTVIDWTCFRFLKMASGCFQNAGKIVLTPEGSTLKTDMCK